MVYARVILCTLYVAPCSQPRMQEPIGTVGFGLFPLGAAHTSLQALSKDIYFCQYACAPSATRADRLEFGVLLPDTNPSCLMGQDIDRWIELHVATYKPACDRSKRRLGISANKGPPKPWLSWPERTQRIGCPPYDLDCCVFDQA